MGIYVALGMSNAIGVFFLSLFLALGAIKASRDLHRGMLDCILRSPMSFFDSTPLGRIVNRFSKDINAIDDLIPSTFRSFSQTFMQVFFFFTFFTILLLLEKKTMFWFNFFKKNFFSLKKSGLFLFLFYVLGCIKSCNYE